METKCAAIHGKMAWLAYKLPITGNAHKARVVSDADMRAVLAGLDMTPKRSGSAQLDRRHDARLDAAKMALMGLRIGMAMAAENIRHF